MARSAETTPGSDPGDAPRGRTRSRERYEARRQEIVDTAARVFAERGYHATTIDDLVEATGLQRGGLYHYIEGKQKLLIRIHERFIRPLLEEAQAVAAADQPPEKALRSLAHALMNDIACYRDQVTVFLHEWRVVENDPGWKDVRAARKEFEDIIADVLQRGVDEGAFSISDLRITVLGFLGMFNYTYQWYDPHGRVSADKLADLFCDVFLQGVKAA